MTELVRLIAQNQNNLDRLRARLLPLRRELKSYESDIHRQVGPYAKHWDEWHLWATETHDHLKGDIFITANFIQNLRECHRAYLKKNPEGDVYTDAESLSIIHSLATDGLTWQKSMLVGTNERIGYETKLAHSIEEAEANDSLAEGQ